jgi:hypothetical protein
MVAGNGTAHLQFYVTDFIAYGSSWRVACRPSPISLYDSDRGGRDLCMGAATAPEPFSARKAEVVLYISAEAYQ